MTGWLDFCISYDQSIVRKNITITSSLKSYCNNVNSLLVNSKLSSSGCWKEYFLSSFLKLSVNTSASFIFLIAEATTSASRLTLKGWLDPSWRLPCFKLLPQSLQIISCQLLDLLAAPTTKQRKKFVQQVLCNILLKLWIHSGFQQVIQSTSSHIKWVIQCKTCS